MRLNIRHSKFLELFHFIILLVFYWIWVLIGTVLEKNRRDRSINETFRRTLPRVQIWFPFSVSIFSPILARFYTASNTTLRNFQLFAEFIPRSLNFNFNRTRSFCHVAIINSDAMGHWGVIRCNKVTNVIVCVYKYNILLYAELVLKVFRMQQNRL